MTDATTFVCQVGALDSTERARRDLFTEILARAKVGAVELGDGWLFELTPHDETFAAVAEWVTYEGRCCPFLRFVIEWRGSANIGLRVTGAPGAKAFIADTFVFDTPDRDSHEGMKNTRETNDL